MIPITKFIDVEGLFGLLDKYSDKLEKGGFGIKKRLKLVFVKNLPKLINTNEVPEGLDIKKILLNVFTKRSYDALGEFSKDAMLISVCTLWIHLILMKIELKMYYSLCNSRR